MLRWFQKRVKSTGRAVLAGMLGVWLATAVAPCVMAGMAESPMPAHQSDAAGCVLPGGGMADDSGACGPVVALDCAAPQLNPPTVSGLDNTAPVPVLLALLPADTVWPPPVMRQRPEFSTIHFAAPLPQYLRHARLLI